MSDELHLLGALAKSTGNRVILWAAAEIARLREERLTEEDCDALYLACAVLDGVFVGSWQEKFDASKRLVDIRDRAIREAAGEVVDE